MTTALQIIPAIPGNAPARPYWSRMGSDLACASTYDQALNVAGLDWGVVMTDPSPTLTVSVQSNGGVHIEPVTAACPDRALALRDDTFAVLGMVGSVYTPISNRDVFAVTDVLARRGGSWLAGGDADRGRTVWMMMRPLIPRPPSPTAMATSTPSTSI